MPATAKVIPGPLHKTNAGAIHWGIQNFVAYGCQNVVVVVDPVSAQVIQTLDIHKTNVTAVQWSNQSYPKDFDTPLILKLSSGDSAGNVVVWDVKGSKPNQVLNNNGLVQKSVGFLQWHPLHPRLLFALHGPSTLVLWDTDAGSLLWKLGHDTFPEPLHTLSIDPFQPTEAHVAAHSGWVFALHDMREDECPVAIERRFRVASGPQKQQQLNGDKDLLQMIRSPHSLGVVFFVLPREILIYDLYAGASLGAIIIDRLKSPIHQVHVGQYAADLLFVLHVDSSLTVYGLNVNRVFEIKATADLARCHKGGDDSTTTKVVGVAWSPMNEHQFVSETSDGRIWQWDYSDEQVILNGLLENLTSIPHSVSVSKHTNGRSTLCAVGAMNGSILIFDLTTGSLRQNYQVHASAVEEVEWIGASSLLSFSRDKVGKKFRNHVVLLNLRNGVEKIMRDISAPESTFIRGIRVSPEEQYILVLFKERPVELWNVGMTTLIRTLNQHANVTAAAWATEVPIGAVDKDVDTSAREHFVLATPDGAVHHYMVDTGPQLIAGLKMQADSGMGITAVIAWRGNFLVSGDTLGTIRMWDFRVQRARSFVTNRGVVRKIVFAPSLRPALILAQFAEGEYGIWDLSAGSCVSVSTASMPSDRVLDLDWVAESHTLAALADGTLAVSDRTSITNTAMALRPLDVPISSPYALPPLHSMFLKSVMLHGINESDDLGRFSQRMGSSDSNTWRQIEEDVNEQIRLMDTSLRQALIRNDDNRDALPIRCRETARYFGDIGEVRFWDLAIFYLNRGVEADVADVGESEEKKKRRSKKEEVEDEKVVNDSLSAVYGILRPSDVVRVDELHRAETFEAARLSSSTSTYSTTQQSASNQIRLAQKEKAVRLLLETPTDTPEFMKDSLKACVVAATMPDKQAFHNTVKLVATTMIATGDLDTGVELLCLIGKSADACRYLQTYDKWQDAATLAKVSLSPSDCRIVMRRWASQLLQIGRPVPAIEILMSQCDFVDVLGLLKHCGWRDTAALFAQACISHHVLTVDTVEEPHSAFTDERQDTFTPLFLLGDVYADYGVHLQILGNTKLSQEYMDVARLAQLGKNVDGVLSRRPGFVG